MKIRLNEIPAEGRSYTFDRKGAELDENLSDLIGTRDYAVTMTINPIGNAYELRGQLHTSVGEVCSKCGYDFDLPLARTFNEILFEAQEEYRKTHSVQGNQSVDFENEQAPSMTPVKGDVFDPGEFVHEAIALTEPSYPTCGPNGSCLRAKEVDEIRSKLEKEWEQAEEKKVGHPAFSVLKSFDITRKN